MNMNFFFCRFVCKALQAIAKDENLVMALIQHLFEIINNSQLYEEKPSTDPKAAKKAVYVACQIPLSVNSPRRKEK